jgi:hypothetical protein
MSDELKPCPFCKCKPDGYEGQQVSCRCGAMGPIETQGDPESAAWNTHADHIQELEAKLEQIEAAWNMALYGDLEHGVASLNEKAHRAFNKGYPNIAAFGSYLVRILYEGEKE